jgi:hypothetical protein
MSHYCISPMVVYIMKFERFSVKTNRLKKINVDLILNSFNLAKKYNYLKGSFNYQKNGLS